MYEELLQHDPFIEWHICKKTWKLTLCKDLKLLEPLQNQCFNNHHSLWFSTHVFHDTQAWLGGTPTKNPRTHNDQTYSSVSSHNAKSPYKKRSQTVTLLWGYSIMRNWPIWLAYTILEMQLSYMPLSQKVRTTLAFSYSMKRVPINNFIFGTFLDLLTIDGL